MLKLKSFFLFSFIFFLVLSVNPLYSQFEVKQDSLRLVKTKIDTNRLLSDRPLKSPWGAVLRSAVLPGWGQAYCRQYVKAGFTFSLDAFLAYHIYWYQKKWTETNAKVYQGKRNLYTWYFSLAYLLTMMDAFVDAYLFKFDDAMNLTQNLNLRDGKWYAEVCFTYRF